MSQRLQGVLGAARWYAPRVAAGWVDARTARSPNGPFSVLVWVGQVTEDRNGASVPRLVPWRHR